MYLVIECLGKKGEKGGAVSSFEKWNRSIQIYDLFV